MGPERDVAENVLFRRFRQGNQHAFESLFHRYYKALCAFALCYLNSQSEAEEIVQDSMVKLWERRDSFQSVEHLRSFLYLTTRNACLDNIKMEHRRLQRDYRYSLEIVDSELAFEHQIIEAELLADIHSAIECLPPQCRKIFELSFYECMSGKEIAELMNISVSTVNNQKARGITLLRKRLSTKGLLMISLFL